MGLTKAVASTCERPDATSFDINSTFERIWVLKTDLLIDAVFMFYLTLTFVGTTVFSFCNPSLGPTSTILTFDGRRLVDTILV